MNRSIVNQKTEKLYDLVAQANEKLLHLWKDEMLFTWRWWVGLALTIIPWLLWIKYRKKDSTVRLLFAGFFVLIIACYLDFIGISFGLWRYLYKVVPFLPAYFPWDFTLLPVIVMSCIQYKPHWSPFKKAVIFAALSAFIGEHFFEWIKLYDPEEWKTIYSFFIYIAIYLIAHYLTTVQSFAPINEETKNSSVYSPILKD